MAYVRKTDTLVDDIRRQCENMSRKAQEQFDVDSVVFTDAQERDLVEAEHLTAWSDAPDLRATMPDTWVATYGKADLRVYGPKDTDGKATRAMVKEVSGHFRLPGINKYQSRYQPNVEVNYDYLPASVKEIVSQSAYKAQKLNETREKFASISQQLRDYMKQHASLNTALKEMPQLEMYVPELYMRKIRAESAPRSKVEQRSNVTDLNIDVDVLTAAAITHRIATA